MNVEVIIVALVVVVIVTLLYKLLPYRPLGDKKPFVSLLPKYKTYVSLPDSLSESTTLSQELAKYGFTIKSQTDEVVTYTRGHMLGDISIKLTKIDLKVSKPIANQSEFTIEAAWVVAFDTGDFWKFLRELKEKIETR